MNFTKNILQGIISYSIHGYFLGVRKKCNLSLKSDTIGIALLYDKAQIVMIMLPKLGYIIIIILALLL